MPQTWNRRLGIRLPAQDVHNNKHNDHQDGDPNCHFAKGANAWHAPLEGKSPRGRETRLAVPASLGLERTDTAAVRA